MIFSIGDKRLKLTLQSDNQPSNDSRGGSLPRATSRSISSSCSDSITFPKPSETDSVLRLEKLNKASDISDQVAEVINKIKQNTLNTSQAQEVATKFNDILNNSNISNVQNANEFKRAGDNGPNIQISQDLKLQVYIGLVELVKQYLFTAINKVAEREDKTIDDGNWDEKEELVASNSLLPVLKSQCDSWIQQLQTEISSETKVAILTLISTWFEAEQQFETSTKHEILWLELRKCLSELHHQVKINALRVLGNGITAISSTDRSLAPEILTLVGRYTNSQDPRVRNSAFEALLKIHKQDYKLDVILYKDFCKALEDDYEGVRGVALSLVHVMSFAYPEHLIKVSNSNTSKRTKNPLKGIVGRENETFHEVRLIDDAFGKICNGVNDLSVHVREKAMKLIGKFSFPAGIGVSQIFLEQTLDKKLMSNMRTKKSAHEREAKMVSAGQWSSGKAWADDAPREEIGADDVNLMSFGACGAFIHGLEDEFMCVRLEAIESLTQLSIHNAGLAATALDFLVDMFNDEIELVRLKAIESLTRIANHITLQVHQLETVMSALDDFSMVVREKLHLMLQASTIATKDGLQNVIAKLLENIKRYPQDRRSILLTFRTLGLKHAELTLPLVTQLLEIHPFFDTAEPDVEDPCYLCILVLVYNASNRSPTLRPLLDHHTKRHFNYLIHTHPNLAKDPNTEKHYSMANMIQGNVRKPEPFVTEHNLKGRDNTVRFLQQVLDRAWSSIYNNQSLSLDGRAKILHRAQTDLQRLGSIEPAIEDAAIFTSIYLQAQGTLIKCLSCRFWNNSTAMFTQQGEIVQNGIFEVFRLCTQLQGKFIISNFTGSEIIDSKKDDIKRRVKRPYLQSSHQIRQICVLKLRAMALHLVFLIRASNKSALIPTECFFKEIEKVKRRFRSPPGVLKISGAVHDGDFLCDLLKQFPETSGGSESRKPGMVARTLQPLLLSKPLDPLSIEDISKVSMSRAIVYEPSGTSDTPLKYTAGLVLAVPVDCDLINVRDTSLVKVAIRTPDQKTSLVTPKMSDFCGRGEPGSYRLRTNALMSHNVWSEALHVEISIVLDFCHDAMGASDIGGGRGNHSLLSNAGYGSDTQDSNFRIVPLSDAIKVYVLPKPIRRGI